MVAEAATTPENDPSVLIVPGLPNDELAVIARRELAIEATGLIADVLDVEVTVDALLRLSQDEEPSEVRLGAKRALRCIESIGRVDSPVVQAVGRVGLYHYVEGVMTYGASENTFLTLMSERGLSAEETTGVYALRQLIAEETNGESQGFPTINAALESLGISLQEAGQDPDFALSRLYEAGFFPDHAGSVIFDRPVFAPRLAKNHIPLGRRHVDTVRSDTDNDEWVRFRFVERLAKELEEE